MDQIADPISLADSLGEALMTKGLLEPSAFDRAKRAGERSGERFDNVLIRLGLVSENDLADALAGRQEF